jgi:2-amino-4-hydroxy-6-hydroxymethyldihydropteridine diphosphokinase
MENSTAISHPQQDGRLRRIAVAFGSNLGDRRGAILAAAADVGRILADFVLSPIIETAPVGPGQQNAPSYLNAVGVGLSTASSRELLHELTGIEQQAGRTRPYPGAPRVLDLDLILAGEDVVDEPDLQVPHSRFRERQFVLEPLATIAADMRDPVTGLTVVELLRRLGR